MSADGCTILIGHAIDRSISENRIVHLDYSDGAAAELLAESDGMAESDEAIEYWGEIDGRPWRVRLDKAVRS